MTGDTHEAAERLHAALNRLGRGLQLPRLSAVAQAAEALARPDVPDAIPAAHTLDDIREDIAAAWRLEGPAALTPARLRSLPLVLWRGSASKGDALSATMPSLWPAFLHRAQTAERLILYAIDGWLRDFDPAIAGLPEAGQDIAARLGQARHPRLLPWAAAHKRFGLFYASSGPVRLAAELLDLNATPETTLRVACLDSTLRQQGNFFRASLLSMLGLTPLEFRKSTAPNSFSRLRPLIEVQEQTRDRYGRPMLQQRLRFGGMEAAVAEGCLRAWADGVASAAAPKSAVQNFLVGTIGDPRLRPQRWAGVPEDITRIMRRWVSEQNLETFLALIKAGGDTAQWRYREAFWRACFRKVESAEVWVVLGRSLAQQANLVSDLAGSFGNMNAAAQAVLLMRMNNIVFSEWSNVGSLRAWEITDPNCPKLYSPKLYSPDALRAPCLRFPDAHGYLSRSQEDGKGLAHFSPAEGHWQARAAHLLRLKTGVRLSHSEYMPSW